MKAIVQSEYGSADVLRLEDVDQPAVASDQVLVKICATSVHAGDWHLMRGTPLLIRLIFGGLLKPKTKTIGTDIAGEVEAVGKAVSQFRLGDQVFGDLSESGFGAFAEYVSVSENALALKPANLSFEEAATMPVSGLAALQALRDVGEIQSGQKVMIHGASGGVGSFAVQLAKAFGAEVTGVCSTHKVDMVKSLGADYVIDYSREDFVGQGKAGRGKRYDLIIDAAAYCSFFRFLPLLMPGGTYVVVGGSTVELFRAMLLGGLISFFDKKKRKVKCLVSKPTQADLRVLKRLAEAGNLRPFINRNYPLSGVPDAIRHLEQRKVKGKVSISVQ